MGDRCRHEAWEESRPASPRHTVSRTCADCRVFLGDGFPPDPSWFAPTRTVRAIDTHTPADGSPGESERRAAETSVAEALASMPVVEFFRAPDWFQLRHRAGGVGLIECRWRHHRAAAWSSWGHSPPAIARIRDLPARLVPVAEADSDPAARGASARIGAVLVARLPHLRWP